MRIAIKATYAMIEQEMTNTLRMVEALAAQIRAAQSAANESAESFGVSPSSEMLAPIVNNQYFTVQPETTAYSAAREADRMITMGGGFR